MAHPDDFHRQQGVGQTRRRNQPRHAGLVHHSVSQLIDPYRIMHLSIRRKTCLRRVIGIALLLWGIGVRARAAENMATSAPGPTAAEAELMALDQSWIDAEVHHDKAALERILDERFLVTSASGATTDRAAFIERIMGKKISPFDVIHDAIVVHDGTALVIDLTTDRATKFTWLAVKKGGSWRVISETMTKVAPIQ